MQIITKSFLPEVNLFQAVINPSGFFHHICNSPPSRSPNGSKTSSRAPRPKLTPAAPVHPPHQDTYNPKALLGGFWVDMSPAIRLAEVPHCWAPPATHGRNTRTQPPASTASEHESTRQPRSSSPLLLSLAGTTFCSPKSHPG